MNLSKKQRSFIRKNAERIPTTELAQKLGLANDKLLEYAQKHDVRLKPTSGVLDERHEFNLRHFLNQNGVKVALLASLSFIVYFNTLGNSFVSDDRDISTRYKQQTFLNEVFTSKPAFRLPGLTHFIDSLGGLAPWRYHLTNIILHTIATLLVFFILNSLVGSQTAFLASLIFAVHPIHTDAVAWVVARSYLLFTTFLLLSLVFYIKSTQNGYLERKGYLLSLFFYLLAIDSRWIEPLTFPIILILYNLSFGNFRKSWKTVVPFFLIIPVLQIYLRSTIQSRIAETATDLGGNLSLANPLIITPIAIYTYLKLFVLSIDLTFYHEDLSRDPLSLTVAATVTIMFVVLTIYLYRKNKTIFFFLSLFLVSIAYTFSPLRISWTVAERYVYFGSIGLSAALASAFVYLPKSKIAKSFSLALFTGIIALYGIRTVIRNFDWKNEDTLWLATVKSSPTSSKAWNNIGDYYGRQGNAQKSFESFVQATRLSPTYADAWHNAGNVLLNSGQTDEAIPYFEKSLMFNPNLTESYNKLAFAYNKKGDREKAQLLIQKSLEINPRSAKTYAALAQIKVDNGLIEEGKLALVEALNLDPGNDSLRQSLTLLEEESKIKSNSVGNH